MKKLFLLCFLPFLSYQLNAKENKILLPKKVKPKTKKEVVLDYHSILIKGKSGLTLPGLFDYVQKQEDIYHELYYQNKFYQIPKSLISKSLNQKEGF